jgi:predicted DNA-binding protein (UPF0251 family)
VVPSLVAVPKPKKHRFVQGPPAVAFFKPQGIPLFQLEQVVLDVDEFEAIRLVDYEGLHLEDAAKRLQVSRATCARIIDSAHHKIGTALTHGHAIRIEGGTFVLGKNRYRCRDCGSRWEIEIGAGTAPRGAVACPACRSDSTRSLRVRRRARHGAGAAAVGAWGVDVRRGSGHGPVVFAFRAAVACHRPFCGSAPS